RTDIIEMPIKKIGVFLLILLHKIEDSRFQSAETEIKPGYLRFGEHKCFGVAMLCMTIDQRPARIRQSEDFGGFVERLPRGVVECLLQQLHFEVLLHQNQLSMPPRNRKTKERKFGNGFFDEVGEYMRWHVIHFDERDIPGECKRFREGCSDQ